MVRDGLVIEQPVGVGRGDAAMALVRGDDHDSLVTGRKVEVRCIAFAEATKCHQMLKKPPPAREHDGLRGWGGIRTHETL